jgi:FdhD protein
VEDITLTYEKHSVLHWNPPDFTPEDQGLIGEEPLSIRIQGNPYSVVMRTPGDEIPHAAGFCLAEGIVDTPDDITSLAFCDGSDSNVVTVTLKPGRRDKISEILDRRGYISQTSCGLCGKEIVDDLYQTLTPLTDAVRIDIEKARQCLEKLSSQQPLREKTRAAHAAALYGSDYRLLSAAEDVGRHNALDKAVGKLFMDKKLDQASLLILSSRISYELVQKAARARIPVVVAMSRPTSLAVTLARRLNMALASHAKGSGLYVFCGKTRFGLERFTS